MVLELKQTVRNPLSGITIFGYYRIPRKSGHLPDTETGSGLDILGFHHYVMSGNVTSKRGLILLVGCPEETRGKRKDKLLPVHFSTTTVTTVGYFYTTYPHYVGYDRPRRVRGDRHVFTFFLSQVLETL